MTCPISPREAAMVITAPRPRVPHTLNVFGFDDFESEGFDRPCAAFYDVVRLDQHRNDRRDNWVPWMVIPH